MARRNKVPETVSHETRQAKGGDASDPSEDISPEPGGSAPPVPAGGGPRIVINPTTFKNQKDALCVAFNEGFRLWMEANDFQPQSEPTDEQRRFFSDTAYADDELQLRRTILARIATFDTSVKDPTDDQISETAQFLGAILESDWCKNEWERDCVSRLANAADAAVGAEPARPKQEPLRARETEPLQAKADMGGGTSGQEEEKKPLPAGKDEAGEKVDLPVDENPENVDLPVNENPEKTDMSMTDGNPAMAGEPMPPAQNAPEPAEPASRPGAIDRPIVEPGSRGSIANRSNAARPLYQPLVPEDEDQEDGLL